MKYNFDEVIDRKNTDSMKWSASYLERHFGSADCVPLWVADMDFADLRLRIEVLYGGDTPVGAVPSMSLGAFRAGQSKDITVDFDASGLTTGKYRVDLVLFEQDEIGTSYDQELLLPAFRMEVKGTEDITWNAKSWGHFRFPDAAITIHEGTALWNE